MKVETLNIELFVEKCLYIAIYGAPSTGKTVIIKNIISILSNKFSTLPIVVAPTDIGNKTYSNILPAQLIFHSFKFKDFEKSDASKFMKQLAKSQESMSNIESSILNEKMTMSKIFMYLPEEIKEKCEKRITYLEKAKDKSENEINNKKYSDDIKEENINKLYDKHEINILQVRKRAILKYYDSIKNNLKDEQKQLIKHFNMRPWKVLILDDCAADLKKKFTTDEEVKKVLYNNRHFRLRTAMTFQDDTDVPPNLRKAFMGSIFTTRQAASHYFESNANGIDKETKKIAIAAIKDVFEDSEKHTKLIYTNLIKPYFFKYKFNTNAEIKIDKPTLEFCQKISLN